MVPNLVPWPHLNRTVEEFQPQSAGSTLSFCRVGTQGTAWMTSARFLAADTRGGHLAPPRGSEGKRCSIASSSRPIPRALLEPRAAR